MRGVSWGCLAALLLALAIDAAAYLALRALVLALLAAFG